MVILAMNFRNKALHNWYSPTQRKFVSSKYFQEFFVPKIFSLCCQFWVHHFLIIAESDILFIAEIKIITKNIVTNSLQQFFAIWLIGWCIEEAVFEGYKFNVFNLIDSIIHKCSYRYARVHQTDIGLLKHSNNANNQISLLTIFCRNLTCLLLEFLFSEWIALWS